MNIFIYFMFNCIDLERIRRLSRRHFFKYCRMIVIYDYVIMINFIQIDTRLTHEKYNANSQLFVSENYFEKKFNA